MTATALKELREGLIDHANSLQRIRDMIVIWHCERELLPDPVAQMEFTEKIEAAQDVLCQQAIEAACLARQLSLAIHGRVTDEAEAIAVVSEIVGLAVADRGLSMEEQ